jgi:hypothetical protein
MLKNLKSSSIAGFFSLIILALFVVTRNLGFFPIPSVILPFNLTVLSSLSYLNFLLIRGVSLYWRNGLNLLFTVFKYYIFFLLTHSLRSEPFNDYTALGHAILLFLGFEMINFVVFLSCRSKSQSSILKNLIVTGMFIISFLAFLLITLSSQFTEPKRTQLIYSGYESSLAKIVQVFYFDYGGSYSSRGGIHCETFVLEQYGIFAKKIPINITDNDQVIKKIKTACSGG